MKVPPGQAGQKCRCARCNAEVLAPASAGHEAPATPQARRGDRAAEGPARPADVPVAKPPPPAIRPPQEFGFECWLCRSRLYARPEQIGQEVTCPDCHSKNAVKTPKAQAKPPAAADDDDDALGDQEVDEDEDDESADGE